MPRPRYPSDQARRKTKPAVRVHHSIRNHPRFAQAFEDIELRGMWLGLMLVASERHAGKTGDIVTLNSGDVVWLTGRRHYASAERALSRLCASFDYALSQHGHGYRVEIRNFAKKQGHTPRSADVVRVTPAASESESESDRERAPLRTGTEAEKRPRRARRTLAPERLDPDQLEDLRLWCNANHPEHLPQLKRLVDDCLTHFRAKGELRASWYATCQTWIKRERVPDRSQAAHGAAYRPYKPPTEPEDDSPRVSREEATRRLEAVGARVVKPMPNG